MTRFLLILAVLSIAVQRCHAFSEHATDIDLPELKRLAGVEVFVTRENDATTVTIELLRKNSFLGQSHFKGFPQVFLSSVVLTVLDDSDQTIVTAPLQVLSGVSGISASGQSKDDFSMITFTVTTKLLPKSRLRFEEIVTHGRQWTDVYFGSKPKLK